MLKPLKITSSPDDLFVISDLHIHHDKPWIVQARGFTSIAEHDETLIARWNETVTDDSIVIHLGDLMARSDEKAFWALIRRLRFKRLLLLLGNHVSGQKQAYQEALRAQFPNAFPPPELPASSAAQAHYEVYPLHVCVDGDPSRTVTFLPEYVEVTVAKQDLVLSHYPIISHHGISKGVIHLTGHSHGNLALTAAKTGQGKRLDVGVESFGRPVSLTEVVRLLQGRDVDARDHHRPGETLS